MTSSYVSSNNVDQSSFLPCILQCVHTGQPKTEEILTQWLQTELQSSCLKTLGTSEMCSSLKSIWFLVALTLKLLYTFFPSSVCPMQKTEMLLTSWSAHGHTHTHAHAHTHQKSSACQQLWQSKIQMIIRNMCPQQRGTETKRSSFSKWPN